MGNRKFMQLLKEDAWKTLQKEAASRAIGVQELIRAVVIPEWAWKQDKKPTVVQALRAFKKRQGVKKRR